MTFRTPLMTVIVASLLGWAVPVAQDRADQRSIRPGTIAELRAWDARLDGMLRSGDLIARPPTEDSRIPGRAHERADQYHAGVRVFGGDVARQLDRGQTISIFGTLYEGIDLDPTPRLTPAEVGARVERMTGVRLGGTRAPELMILPTSGGGYALTYRVRVATLADVRVYFLDANTGDVRLDYSDRKTQSAVGRGVGVLGDTKKLSAFSSSGRFVARDELRPPSVVTFDMRGDVERTLDILNGFVSPTDGDIASDDDNDWTDGAAVDAHAYAGWVYDYFFKRFGRRGLDDRDLRTLSFVHPVRREEFFENLDEYGDDVLDFYLNAFYCCDGVMVYGEGLPPDLVLTSGQTVDFFSGGLDVVAHELSHGVTDFTSNLIYRNESGALNEAFSDVMGTSVEFFFEPPGDGLQQADYLLGEDVLRPGGFRSMSNPGAFGDPDHYSKRYTGTDDNGGVHINSSIANQAFYLAVEGGTNRTSGRPVTGVGAANREQIEQIFYRAFTLMLPSNATFSVARAACDQAARDLYGAGSAPHAAITQAWAAVGVQ